MLTKTSLMLGLGESEARSLECMDDLRAVGVDILTLGQYLRPTRNHLAVERFVTPEQFERYRQRDSRSDFASALPDRWCARATAPSRRWPATTSVCAAAAVARAVTSTADPLARACALRADLARDAAVHRGAQRPDRR